jgi:hypothetical protein
MRTALVSLALSIFLITSTVASAHSPRLQKTEVPQLAREAARNDHRKLSDYIESKPRFELTRKDYRWTVFYEGKVPMPGNHFLV